MRENDNQKYRFELEKHLGVIIATVLNFYLLNDVELNNIRETVMEIFDYMVRHGMSAEKIPYNFQEMAQVLIFYAFLDLNITSLGITSIGQVDISKALRGGSDPLIYLKPRKIYNFLPNRLQVKIDSLPSPKSIIFSKYYRVKLRRYLSIIFGKIIAKYSISTVNVNELMNTALDLFNHALQNKLTPEDLKKNRMPNQLALILAYFSLIHYEIYYLGDKTVNIHSIVDSIENLALLNFNSKNAVYIYPNYMLPFLPKIYRERAKSLHHRKIIINYDAEFRGQLEFYLQFIATKLDLIDVSVDDIVNEGLSLFDNALINGLTPDKLGQYKFARFISICLIYYSLISNNIMSLGSGALSVRDITNIIADDYDKLGFGSADAMKFGCGFLNEYIPYNILNKIEALPQTIGIIFNEDYFNDLKNYLSFISSLVRDHYELDIMYR
jgi:hypothetical protein